MGNHIPPLVKRRLFASLGYSPRRVTLRPLTLFGCSLVLAFTISSAEAKKQLPCGRL